MSRILSIYQSCRELVVSLHMVKGTRDRENSNKRKSKKYSQMKKLCAKTVEVITLPAAQ